MMKIELPTPRAFTAAAAVALSLAVLSAVPSPVRAHDGPVKPLHGGVAAEVREIHYEQVVKGDSVMIYVYDHGKPVSTKGATGKLTVLNGADKTELALAPEGDNTLRAQGGKFASGTKSIALITLQGKKPASIRFAIK